MALNRKLEPYHKKCLQGDYDNLLRTLPLFTAVPALVLVAVDLHRYTKNSKLHQVQRHSSLILDAILLAFLSLDILWALVWNIVCRYRKIELRAWIFCVDLLLLTAVLSLGDTTLSMRSSKTNCSNVLGECNDTALAIMRAAGALVIITSVPQHVLCVGICHRFFVQRRRNKRTNRNTDSTEEGPALTFENEIKEG